MRSQGAGLLHHPYTELENVAVLFTTADVDARFIRKLATQEAMSITIICYASTWTYRPLMMMPPGPTKS